MPRGCAAWPNGFQYQKLLDLLQPGECPLNPEEDQKWDRPTRQHILVVDDTPPISRCSPACSRTAATRSAPFPAANWPYWRPKRDPPDLILLDINMPEMNGYEVCERLKADDKLKGIPVIFISALTEQLDKVKAFAIGGVDYITKPFQMEELHARVETHLKIRRLQTELEEYSHHLELARERLKFDLELARKVQRGFLPLQMPEVPGYAFFAYYESAYEIGGDYYDFIPLPEGRMAILLGDVAGKGVVAALLMAKLSANAKFCMLTEPDPATAITRLNALMIQSGMADRFVTLIAAVLDPTSHTVTLVNAGHPSPLIYHRSTGTVEEAISTTVAGPPLGILDGFEYESCRIILVPGDSILAFTDGVTEATNDKDLQFQTQGAYAAVQGGFYSTKALGEQVVEAVKQFATGRSQQDDIALVGFGRVG